MINHKIDSVTELKKRKTYEEIAAENQNLSLQVTDLQIALCDIFEMIEAPISPTE